MSLAQACYTPAVHMSALKPRKLETQFNLRESELISGRFALGLFPIVGLLNVEAKAVARGEKYWLLQHKGQNPGKARCDVSTAVIPGLRCQCGKHRRERPKKFASYPGLGSRVLL